jgi:hypothetical protein
MVTMPSPVTFDVATMAKGSVSIVPWPVTVVVEVELGAPVQISEIAEPDPVDELPITLHPDVAVVVVTVGGVAGSNS